MKSNYESQYRVRKYFVVNNGDGVELDPDLKPIVFSLPTPPSDWRNIKNYGLHPDDQVYRKDEVPKRLKTLETETIDEARNKYESSRNETITGYKLLRDFWDKLSAEAEFYEAEIKWMRNVIWKRYYGEWVFIDGQLIWFPPRYYMYVNFWHMNVDKGYETPEFRIRDWKSACVTHYLRHTTEGFDNLNNNGIAQKENGVYEIKDYGSRTFYGPIRPKNRRSGATHEALNELHETVCTGIGKKATTLSKSVTDVEAFFDEMLFPAWRRLPMFLRPIWMGSQAEGKSIDYKAPTSAYGITSMESTLYYVKSTDEIVIDSKRLDCILLDEQGKKTGGGRVDVSDRWGISKQTLSTGDGANIHGLAMNPSTAEEMDDGAKQYKMMCDMSDFYQRSETGQTKSGLMLVYFPAQYCLEGFVDCFGKAVIDIPTERQIKLSQKHNPDRNNRFVLLKAGSRHHLTSNRNQLLVSGKPDDLREYRKLRRKHPMSYMESWMGDAGDMGFPIIQIDSRVAEIESLKKPVVDYGHFEWIGGVYGGPVVWVPGDIKDKFELSYHIKSQLANRITQKRVFNGITQVWEWQKAPLDPRFILGGDTFGFDNKSIAAQREDRSRKSDGGIGGYYPYDSRIDGGKTADQWDSDRFILSYRFKPPSADAYNEDMLMAAIYLGALVYPENNNTNTWEYFIRNGMGGYLKHDINLSTGKENDKPGYWVGTTEKDEMFKAVIGYLNRNVHRERHVRFLIECKSIRGPEELKNHDRLAAHGAALRGARDMSIKPSSGEEVGRIKKAYEALSRIM